MSKPVKNWHVMVGNTSIFFDIVDSDLRFFGPRAVWRSLNRKDLGQKKIIFNGVVDLGYEKEELQYLAGMLPGKKILPLSISGSSELPELSIEISAPHSGGLVALNTLPFPQYRLAVTVDAQATDAGALIQSIQDGWAQKTLLKGKYVGSADGVSAEGGYNVIIDAKSCIADLIANGCPREIPIIEAWQEIRSAIQRHQPAWLAYYGASEVQSEHLLAEAALAGVLYERCFDQITAIRYDNGISAFAARLRDGSTMGEPEARILVLSKPAKIVVDVRF
jgi:hypothetical protein